MLHSKVLWSGKESNLHTLEILVVSTFSKTAKICHLTSLLVFPSCQPVPFLFATFSPNRQGIVNTITCFNVTQIGVGFFRSRNRVRTCKSHRGLSQYRHPLGLAQARHGFYVYQSQPVQLVYMAISSSDYFEVRSPLCCVSVELTLRYV